MLAVEKSLEAFRPEGMLPLAHPPLPPEAGVETLASWLDHRHVLLLRTLLENTEEAPRLPGAPALLRRVHRAMDELRRDAQLKFAEFRERWAQRLAVEVLLPFLTRNQWFVDLPEGGTALAGKGDGKEAKMLYLQTLHDMASDCARQWGAVAGRWQALQAEFIAAWHKEAVSDNSTRILPVLEVAARQGEIEAWKSLRLSLGDFAEGSFTRAVERWEGRRFADSGSLVRDLAAPWRDVDAASNGFIGFMRALSRVAERLTLAMLDHYDRKWELYLRGFAAA